jgi:hypothetical protein
MYVEQLHQAFWEREPILKEELRDLLPIQNQNTFNQVISYLVSFGLLRRLENGLYYIPSKDERFSHLKPSIRDVVHKKYLSGSSGFRTGGYLLYKYKLTSQVSEYYEILSMQVSTHSRSKQEFDGKVIVSYPKFAINADTILYHEFLELVKHSPRSDTSHEDTIHQLRQVLDRMDLDRDTLIHFSRYYRGNRLRYVRHIVDEVLQYETAS